MTQALYIQREPWRLSTALVIAVILHALLLNITLGGQTFGLPGLRFPWLERRLHASDLQILLLPAQPTAPVPALSPADAPPSPVAPPPIATENPSIPSAVTSATMSPPRAQQAPATPAAITPDIPLPTAPAAPPVVLPTLAETKQKQLEQDTRDQAIELARIEQEKQIAERLRQSELIAEAQREATRQELLRQEAARAEAARIETERQEALRREAQRQEQFREAAARAEQIAKAEATRKEAERAELIRLENQRLEELRQEQAKQEAVRQELERVQTARIEAERKEATRQEQARQAQLEAARQVQQEATRQDATKQEAARLEQAKKEQAKLDKAKQEAEREERLRAIGRQLNEEAAQRDAALKNPSRSLLPTVSGLRRGWLFGRADPNADLVQYAEAMSKKFELNMAFDMVREVVKQRHVSPMVTVAIRADGSVEKVTIVVSSGVPAIDDAIRKVVTNQAPYGAFPPALARLYDVIEIRRTWVFDTAIRLQ